MIFTLGPDALARYVSLQLDFFFPDRQTITYAEINMHMQATLDRVEACFSAVRGSRYFQQGGEETFNHLHSDQYAMFLYFLANTLYRAGVHSRICEKLFYLNKTLNGIDVFYDVELPDIFLFCHPLGTVLGRAKYSNYLLVYQSCTVGSAREGAYGEGGIYPTIGKHCTIYSGASILGDCHIGENCKLSAGSILLDSNLADNRIYIGTPRDNVEKVDSKHHPIWGE